MIDPSGEGMDSWDLRRRAGEWLLGDVRDERPRTGTKKSGAPDSGALTSFAVADRSGHGAGTMETDRGRACAVHLAVQRQKGR